MAVVVAALLFGDFLCYGVELKCVLCGQGFIVTSSCAHEPSDENQQRGQLIVEINIFYHLRLIMEVW